MPRNTGLGGNKRKKGKKKTFEVRELIIKGEMEEYAQVLKIMGDGRFECQCCDGVKRKAHVRGKMRKKIWIVNGDVVLVSLREFENDKCDIVAKYTEEEVKKLKKAGEIPDSIVLPNNDDKKQENDGDIIFEDVKTTEKEQDKDDFFNQTFTDDEDEEKKEKPKIDKFGNYIVNSDPKEKPKIEKENDDDSEDEEEDEEDDKGEVKSNGIENKQEELDRQDRNKIKRGKEMKKQKERNKKYNKNDEDDDKNKEIDIDNI